MKLTDTIRENSENPLKLIEMVIKVSSHNSVISVKFLNDFSENLIFSRFKSRLYQNNTKIHLLPHSPQLLERLIDEHRPTHIPIYRLSK